MVTAGKDVRAHILIYVWGTEAQDWLINPTVEKGIHDISWLRWLWCLCIGSLSCGVEGWCTQVPPRVTEMAEGSVSVSCCCLTHCPTS